MVLSNPWGWTHDFARKMLPTNSHYSPRVSTANISCSVAKLAEPLANDLLKDGSLESEQAVRVTFT